MNRFLLSLVLTIVAASHAAAKPTLAVLDLDTIGVSPQESRVLLAKVTSELVASGTFTILERTRMDEILQEQAFQQSGCVSSSCAVEVGQLLGVRFMAAGSLGTVGDTHLFTLRIVDVGTGVVLCMGERQSTAGVKELLSFWQSSASDSEHVHDATLQI